MEEPDFESYNLKELYEAYNRINREKYPERFERINAILNDPVKLEKLKSTSSYQIQEPKSVVAHLTEFVTESPFWLSILGLPVCLTSLYIWLSTGEATMRGVTLYSNEKPILFWLLSILLFLFCIALLASFTLNVYRKLKR